jgi:hypothetical protein
MDYHQSHLLSLIVLSVLFSPCAFAKEHISPSFALGAAQPLSLGVQTEVFEKGDLFANIGYLPLKLSKIQLSLFTVQAGVRFFPYEAIFVSASLGFRSLQVIANTSSYAIDELTLSQGRLSFHTIFFSPMVGYQWKISEVLFLRSGFGVQIALWGKGALVLENTQTKQNSDNNPDFSTGNEGQLNRVAFLLFPVVSLIEVQWNFF